MLEDDIVRAKPIGHNSMRRKRLEGFVGLKRHYSVRRLALTFEMFSAVSTRSAG